MPTTRVSKRPPRLPPVGKLSVSSERYETSVQHDIARCEAGKSPSWAIYAGARGSCSGHAEETARLFFKDYHLMIRIVSVRSRRFRQKSQ
jgi:hypothetical protein